MKYKECYETGNTFRQEYKNSIDALIKNKLTRAKIDRNFFVQELIKHPEQYREKLKAQLGWPLTEKTGHEIPNAKKTLIAKEEDMCVYRIQLEIFDDFWYYGLLFVKEDGKKRPFVIAQHGGNGTPESYSGLLPKGARSTYDMTERVIKYDINVFAPQMLLWAKDTYKIDYNREEMDTTLKQCGGSITALELHCLMKSLDYFEQQDYVDNHKIGMVGLSYGGMYTMYLTALDERIKSAFSCSYFCNRLGEKAPDRTYFNAANTFTDAEVVMLARPRIIHLAIGDNDELFPAAESVKEFERIKSVFNDYAEWTSLSVFEGGHELCHDDSIFSRFILDLVKNRKEAVALSN